MAVQRQPYTLRGRANTASRSIRIDNEVWAKAKARAQYEGITLNYVLTSFVEAYANGIINTPRLTVSFSQQVQDDRHGDVRVPEGGEAA